MVERKLNKGWRRNVLPKAQAASKVWCSVQSVSTGAFNMCAISLEMGGGKRDAGTTNHQVGTFNDSNECTNCIELRIVELGNLLPIMDECSTVLL